MPVTLLRFILTIALLAAFGSPFLYSPIVGAQSVGESAAEAAAAGSRRGEPLSPIDSFNGRFPSESFERVWQMTGPFGGDVTALAVDPRNPDTILIGASDSQIYRSTDGGTIWKRLRPGIRAPGFIITVLQFDREKAGTIYAGVKPLVDLTEETAGGGLFISDDNGDNWRPSEGMNKKAVRGLVQSSKDTNVLVAAARTGIYRSMDRGLSWDRITPVNDPELTGFHSVAVDPTDPDKIYVGTYHLPWRTTNGGKTWKRAGSKETGMIDDSDIMAIHIDDENPDIVLMSACSGIYRSTDGCERWSKIQGIPYSSRRTHVIYQHPTRPEVIFAGTTEGLWISTNNGKPDSWRRVTSLRLVINAIAVHPSKPDRVYLGTEDNGVLVSNDGGESYESSNAGFINRQVRAVLADRKEKGRVYAGIIFDGSNSGLFVSEDGGLTWEQSMTGMGMRDVYSLYQSELNPDTIYAGTNAGLFRSDDQGRNWSLVRKEDPQASPDGPVSPALDAPIAPGTTAPLETVPSAIQEEPPPAQPARPRRVFSKSVKPVVLTATEKTAKAKAASVKRQAKKPAQTVAKTKPKPAPKAVPDGRVELQSQVFLLAPFTVKNEQDGPDTKATWIIALTWDGLFYTEDEKKGWLPFYIRRKAEGDAVLPAQPRVNTLATTALNPGVIYAGTEEGLFVSRNNGESFDLVKLDEDVTRIRCVLFDPRNAERVYVGTSSGFFRSMDGGATWEKRGGGMPLVVDVSTITVSAVDPDELYLSDDLRGAFYHSKDRGRNWDRLDISQLPSLKLRTLYADPFDSKRVYAGSFSGGVYVMSRR